MKGVGSRQMRLWGMDAYLSFDQEKNLEIVLTMPLPNRYFGPVFFIDRDKAIEFYDTVTPKVRRILQNSAFIGDVDITEIVSTMGLVTVGGAMANYMILTRSGVPFRASIHKSGKLWELSLSSTGHGISQDKYNPEFLKILGRSRSGGVADLSNPQYSLTDQDIEDALKIKPLEHTPPPNDEHFR
jgi:hypothetical protein